MYDFKGKFALVTGGGQGIGFAFIQSLLSKGIEGITLVEMDAEKGRKSVKVLNCKFGGDKVIFVEADVSNADQFKDAFETSLKHWKALDIVINNAGVIDEIKWEMEISTNCVGVVTGTMLGLEYMSKNKNGRGGVIINISSISGLGSYPMVPIYGATKSFVISLGRSLGTPIYFNYNGVRILTICPGAVESTLLTEHLTRINTNICPNLSEFAYRETNKLPTQSTDVLANNMVYILKNGCNGSVWVSEGSDAPYELKCLDRYQMRKH